MNLLTIPGLTTVSVPSPGASGIPARWFRAVPTAHRAKPLATAHSVGRRNRFNPGRAASPVLTPPFALLYLAEDPLTALMEVRALFGNPVAPATWVRNPLVHYSVFPVRVSLKAVVDLTDVANQGALATTAQELTGDWEGYQTRRLPWSSIPRPTGKAPTQELGEGLAKHAASSPLPIDGFLAISARVPLKRNLVLFDPAQLAKQGWINIEDEVVLGKP